ncbi:MAG: AMIN domain-containing protein, partial [Caldimonas sp.]
MASWRSRIFVLALMTAAASPAWSQVSIQSINSSQQAGSEVIRIELSEPLTAVPAGFTVQAPPRIALDLPGVSNALGKNTVDINQGNLRSVSIAQSGERTRLVLNLKQPAGYRAVIEGKSLVVSLDNNAPATLASSSGQTTRFAESLNRTQ